MAASAVLRWHAARLLSQWCQLCAAGLRDGEDLEGYRQGTCGCRLRYTDMHMHMHMHMCMCMWLQAARLRDSDGLAVADDGPRRSDLGLVRQVEAEDERRAHHRPRREVRARLGVVVLGHPPHLRAARGAVGCGVR